MHKFSFENQQDVAYCALQGAENDAQVEGVRLAEGWAMRFFPFPTEQEVSRAYDLTLGKIQFMILGGKVSGEDAEDLVIGADKYFGAFYNTLYGN